MKRAFLIAPLGLSLATCGTRAYADATVANGVLSVSPSSASQGTVGLTVTFNLSSNSTPPLPPTAVLPTSAMLGTNMGSVLARPSQYVAKAQFTLSAVEAVELKDVAVSFPFPGGTLTYSRAQAFQVLVGSGVPVAGFVATPNYGTSPLTVSFTDASSGTITNRLWNFGDSTTGTNVNPTHTYSALATYAVCLTVSGPGGTNTLTRANYITVAANLAASMIVDTGQTNCYNTTGIVAIPLAGQSLYGQDAQFYGNQPSYTLSGDGLTVFDNNTGLSWMRGPNTNLASPVSSDKLTLSAARTWVTTLNAAQYGGFSDWRLPTIKELYSLFDCRGTDPSSYSGSDTSVLTPFIDTHFFNFAWGQTSQGERVIDSQYASSDVFVLNPAETGYPKLFGVNFADGRIKGYDLIMPDGTTEKTFFVQLVRGGMGYGFNSFTNNGDGTVTDLSTGLMWSRADNGSGLLWANALAWVQTKNAANHLGHSDWRLPNVKELQSIVNYSNAPDYNGLPAINTNFFTCTLITNEAGKVDYPYYWTGSTHGGYSTNNAGGGEADYVAFGRALGWPSGQPNWVDVHGAGCQRSDPKVAPPYGYATVKTVTNNAVVYTGYSFGPQGDAIRGYNYVRLVRGGNDSGVDHVGDGIPDGWRRLYFGGSGIATNANSSANSDADYDGMSNYAEYIANTNPTNARSFFHILRLSRFNGWSASFVSSTNRIYTLYYRTNLTFGAWTSVPSQTGISGGDGVGVLTDPSPAGTYRYYRIGVRLP